MLHIALLLVVSLFAGQKGPSTPADRSETQFDLICRVTSGPADEPTIRLRIDLGRRSWCRGACPSVSQINAISPDRITLLDLTHEGRSLTSRDYIAIDRVSGRYLEQSSMIGGISQSMEIEAECDAAPFSGMPAARF